MADYIQFTGPIKPLGSATFAILEDVFLQGSYRVLNTEAEKDIISPDACTVGMIVKCLDSGKMYSLSALTIGEDEFGDPTATSDFALTAGLTTDLVPWAEISANLTFGITIAVLVFIAYSQEALSSSSSSSPFSF